MCPPSAGKSLGNLHERDCFEGGRLLPDGLVTAPERKRLQNPGRTDDLLMTKRANHAESGLRSQRPLRSSVPAGRIWSAISPPSRYPAVMLWTSPLTQRQASSHVQQCM